MASGAASKEDIKNDPGEKELAHIKEMVANMLQPIRTVYNKPIKVTSGYRCQKLNSAVGGTSTSQHTTGYAADIKPGNASDMMNLKKMVLLWARTHNFDQIILEQCDAMGNPSWIHIGWKHSTKGQRRQILTAKKTAGKWVYSVYK